MNILRNFVTNNWKFVSRKKCIPLIFFWMINSIFSSIEYFPNVELIRHHDENYFEATLNMGALKKDRVSVEENIWKHYIWSLIDLIFALTLEEVIISEHLGQVLFSSNQWRWCVSITGRPHLVWHPNPSPEHLSIIVATFF